MQTPVFVLSDLELGMNQWMTEPFKYPDTPMDRGKVLWEEDLEKLKGDWGRYRDVDGDGIPYRTFPGNKHPAQRILHARHWPQRKCTLQRRCRYLDENDGSHQEEVPQCC